MPSQYSPRLRVELVADGEQLGVWGRTTNRNLGTLLETAIAGYRSIALPDANYVLTAISGQDDDARYAVLEFTGSLTAPRTVTAPAVSKTYILRNSTNRVLTFIPSGGTGVTIPVGKTRYVVNTGSVLTDAFNVVEAIDANNAVLQAATIVLATINGGTATLSQINATGGTLNGVAVRGLPTPTLAGDATPKSYVDVVTTAAQASADAAALSASQAATSAAAAFTSEQNAATSASAAAAAANYKGDWLSTTTYSVGQSVTYMGIVYFSKVNNNLNNIPVEGANWTVLTANAGQVKLTTTTADTVYPLVFGQTATTGFQTLSIDGAGGTYNPATNTATINITGSASTATNATNANNLNVTTTAGNANYPLVFAPSQTTGQQALLIDSAGGTYNPATNTADLNISGNAATATSAASATNATNTTNVNVTTSAANASYPFVLAPSQATGQQALLIDSAAGTYNPATNTADINIAGTAVNVSGGTANVTSLNNTGNSTFGDSGTDLATLNSQLFTGGSVGVLGQVLTSRGPDMSPQWINAEGGLQQKDIGFLLINAGVI